MRPFEPPHRRPNHESALHIARRPRYESALRLARRLATGLLLCAAFPLLAAVILAGCRNELQTVVQCSDRTVVVRYEDGRLAEVLNDMEYELEPGQRVKVTENCDGDLHVVVAYAQR